MRTRAERRFNTERKIKHRKHLMKSFGLQSGSVYEKHRQKINSSLGFMRDGNVDHYVSCGFSKKTKNSARHRDYGSKFRFSHHDLKENLRGSD